MIEVQYREKVSQERLNQFTSLKYWTTWHELGKFKSILLAMRGILDQLPAPFESLAINDFHFSNHSENCPVYELKTGTVYQIRFVKLPDSPWKIGLNDND